MKLLTLILILIGSSVKAQNDSLEHRLMERTYNPFFAKDTVDKVHWANISTPDSTEAKHAAIYFVNGVQQDRCPIEYIDIRYIKTARLKRGKYADTIYLVVDRRHVVVSHNSFSTK